MIQVFASVRSIAIWGFCRSTQGCDQSITKSVAVYIASLHISILYLANMDFQSTERGAGLVTPLVRKYALILTTIAKMQPQTDFVFHSTDSRN